MAKKRKTRDYGSIFKNKAASDLPTPEEVNKKVADLSEKSIESSPPVEPKVVQEPLPTISKPAPNSVADNLEAINVSSKETETEASKRGRKPLEVRRVPYTTSITEDHKFNLKYHAMRKGMRPSDMLHAILEDFFKNNPI